jgi:hypothetical protein
MCLVDEKLNNRADGAILQTKIAIGIGRISRSIGSTLSEQCFALNHSTESWRIVKKRPVSSRCKRTCIENEVMLALEFQTLRAESHQFCKSDFAAASPSTAAACHHAEGVLAENVHTYIVRHRFEQAPQQQIDAALS